MPELRWKEGEYPPEDCQYTWHVHDNGSWAWGATCGECVAPPMPKYRGPAFNIKRLKADNAGGYTQRELAREITDAADRDGRNIEHPR
jgi:hypothetical protein